MERQGYNVRAAMPADPQAGLATLRPPAPSLDELLARADIWRGNRLAGSAADGIATGFAALDAVLPGAGWPPGALVEILGQRSGTDGSGELSLLLPALARQTQAGGWAVLVDCPWRPHAPAWAAAGVDLSRLIVVEAGARDHLWAIDRSLRSGAVDAILAWLPPLDTAALRRLQLAAEEGGATLFAFRPPACAAQASPAPLRLAVVGTRAGVEIRILKRRGPLLPAALNLPVARPVAASPASSRGNPASVRPVRAGNPSLAKDFDFFSNPPMDAHIMRIGGVR